jgi:hypothetical protein
VIKPWVKRYGVNSGVNRQVPEPRLRT